MPAGTAVPAAAIIAVAANTGRRQQRMVATAIRRNVARVCCIALKIGPGFVLKIDPSDVRLVMFCSKTALQTQCASPQLVLTAQRDPGPRPILGRRSGTTPQRKCLLSCRARSRCRRA